MCSLKFPAVLEEAIVPELPPTAYYIPNFITTAEETALLESIETAPKSHWTHLTHRRLIAYPSALSASNTLLASPLPSWLTEPIVSRIISCSTSASLRLENLFSVSPHHAPNHCLINEYHPGQGILPHEDGGAYWPVVVTVTLGSHGVLDIYEKPAADGKRDDMPKWRILQERGSLLLSTKAMYTDYLHGIEATESDIKLDECANWSSVKSKEEFVGKVERGTRISLTFRDVLNVKKLGKGFGFLSKGV